MSDPAGLFAEVPGQDEAVAQLVAALKNPVHAYLLTGPPGSGKELAARRFATALLCPNGGCGECRSCRLALEGRHPDLVVAERTGATVSVEDLRKVTTLAQRRPLEGPRQVLVVDDVHLATRSAPALLKTLEEPPAGTIFLLLADDLPPELITIASRCVGVAFPPLSTASVAAYLERQGADPERAKLVARAAGGDLDRARLLLEDPQFAARLELWKSVPRRLDGYGSTAAVIARELVASTDAAVLPLVARHQAEMEQRQHDAEAMGERGVPGRKELQDRHARAERRFRQEELRAGLGVLQRAYANVLAEALVPGHAGVAARRAEQLGCAKAIDSITEAARSLRHNPNELLLLEGLLSSLGALQLPT